MAPLAAEMAFSGPVTVEQLVQLQRAAGNRAVVGALAARAPRPPRPAAPAAPGSAAPKLSVQRSACCTSCAGGGSCKENEGDNETEVAPSGPTVQTLPLVNVQRGMFDNIGSAIAGGARAIGSGIASAAGAVGSSVSNAARAVGSAVRGAAGAVGSAVGSVLPDWIRNLFNRGPADAERATGQAAAGAEHAHQEATQADTRSRNETQNAAERSNQQTGTEVERVHGSTERQATGAETQTTQIRDVAATGLRVLRGTAPLLAPTLVPGVLLADPGRVAQVAERVGGAAADVGGRAAAQIGQGIGGLRQDLGSFRWTCDTAEITALAGRVSRRILGTAVGVADTLTGGRASQALAFAGRMGERVGAAARNLGQRIRGVATAVRAEIGRRLAPVAATAQRIGTAIASGARSIAAAVGRRARELKDRVSAGLQRVGSAIGAGVQALGQRVRQGITNIVAGFRRAFSVAGSIITTIFPGAQGLLDRVMGLVERGRALIAAGLARARERLSAARAWVVTHARQAADRALQHVARLRQRAGQRLAQVRQWVSRHRAAIIAAIPGGALIAAGVAAARTQAGRLRSAAQAVARRAAGAVCSVANDIGGPCVNQYLPNPGPGNAATLTGSMSADVTLPLHEFGVPCSAKVAQGGTVAVKREGDDFTVTLTGQGSVMAVENLEVSASGTASIDLPAGGTGQVWNQLGGRSSAAPAAAAAGASGVGQAVAGASSGGGSLAQIGSQAAQGQAAGGTAGAASPGAKLEGGVRGTLASEYKFSARGSNCNGVGGMLGLLAALGLAGRLPSPLNHLATAATEFSFTDQLQKVSFTAAGTGRASIDLLSGSAGTIKGALGLEASVGSVHRRATDADRAVPGRAGAIVDGFIDEMVVQAGVTGEAGFELPGMGGVSGIGASTSAGAQLSLTLLWNHGADSIVPEKAEGKVTLEVGVTGVDLAALARLLPADASPAIARVRAMLARPVPAATKLSFEATAVVDNLDVLSAELNRFFSTPESVTVDGAMAIVRRHLATGVTRGIKLTLTQTSRLAGITVGGQGTVEGATIAANASASLDAALEQQLYPAA